MPATVYILYSPKTDKYYIGATTDDITIRLERHNSLYYQNKYTANGIPWQLFFKIDVDDMPQALLIEKHIKNMKSRKYIENLKQYPEIAQQLKNKYPATDS